MNNNIFEGDNVSKLPPGWSHPVLPPNAMQGSLLFVINNFVEPPQSSGNFRWVLMEDLIGVANMKLEYNEEKSIYTLSKAKGHLNNDGNWVYEYEPVGEWVSITEAVKEALESLVYFEYRFDTSTPNILRVYGKKKDGTEDQICYISFATKQEFDLAIQNLQQQIDNIVEDIAVLRSDLQSEINRATNKENELNTKIENEIQRAVARENELEDLIEENRVIAGDGLEYVGG